MASYNQTSPIHVLQPQLPPQPSYNSPSLRPTFNSPGLNGIDTSSQPSSWSSLAPASSSASLAGRKRSRDEAASNLEDDFGPEITILDHSQYDNEDEWVYGEGMVLIKPGGSGYIMAAGSQTGTWADEKAEEGKKQLAMAVPSFEKPTARSAKSQKLNRTASPLDAEDGMGNGSAVTSDAILPGKDHQEPTVDEFTRLLGVGWSKLNPDPDLQAAVRGWNKFIDNYFPITNPKIKLESRGLASYLVEADEGYFLFREGLHFGMLVSTSLEKTWENLQGPEPIFDGESTMEAGVHLTVEEMDAIDDMDEMDGETTSDDDEVADQNLGFEMDMN